MPPASELAGDAHPDRSGPVDAVLAAPSPAWPCLMEVRAETASCPAPSVSWLPELAADRSVGEFRRVQVEIEPRRIMQDGLNLVSGASSRHRG
jgi:hypothetical protein